MDCTDLVNPKTLKKIIYFTECVTQNAVCILRNVFFLLILAKSSKMAKVMEINPFLVNSYISKEYFCDRDNELNILLRNVQSNVNTTLISPRRLGKTGLIFRFFELLREGSDYGAVYVDIYSSRNLADFIKLLTAAIINRFPERTPVGKRFLKLIKGLRPTFSFDAITGTPQVQFSYQSESDKEYTLLQLLTFINEQPKPVVVALDEFQQIAHYPEKNVEAILRTYTQQFNNVCFIFSGSRRHTLMDIFANAKRPFYSSTRFMNLEAIERGAYRNFIREKFEQGKRTIDDESIDYVLEWTKGYTFYTQSLCNRLFSYRKINLDTVKTECLALLKENEPVYLQYRNLMTSKQWEFLLALAKEESVLQIYSKEFLLKHQLGTPSSIRRLLDSLLEKEMVLEAISSTGSSYSVYDVFLMRWMQRTY